MKPLVLVTGHRAPDCDSLAAASALAWWANATGAYGREAVAVRQGPVPPAAAWLYERAGWAPPALRTDCRPTAAELARPALSLPPQAPLGRVMAEILQAGADVAVLTQGGRVAGVVSPLAPRTAFLLQSNIEDFIGTLIDFAALAAGLGLRRVEDSPPPGPVSRLVLAIESKPALGPGDVLVCGHSPVLWLRAREAGVAAVVVVGEPPAEGLPGLSLWSYAGSAASLASRLAGCFPAELAKAEETLLVDGQALLPEVRKLLARSPHGLPVVDAQGALAGVLTHTAVVNARAHAVALVDHCERAQSIGGLEEAEVLEIVDHHRLGDIETVGPLRIDARPWGSTASILADRLLAGRHEPPAGLWLVLLGALVADTLLLTSPTTTPDDRRLAPELARRAGVDLRTFGLELLRQNDRLALAPADDLVAADAKPYTAGQTRLLVAQTETCDLGQATPELLNRLEAALARAATAAGAALGVLMVTDVLAGDSLILLAGDERLRARVLPAAAQGASWRAPGWVSRKKQLLPHLLESLRADA